MAHPMCIVCKECKTLICLDSLDSWSMYEEGFHAIMENGQPLCPHCKNNLKTQRLKVHNEKTDEERQNG